MTNGTPGDYVDFLPLAERWGVEVFLHIIDYVQNATMIINPRGIHQNSGSFPGKSPRGQPPPA